MKCTVSICVLSLLGLSLSLTHAKLHPLSDEFIHSINTKQDIWKAGRNFHADTPLSHFRSLVGVLPRKEGQLPQLPRKTHSRIVANIPASFDSREAWPECASLIGEIKDQSDCGSCWAFGAAEAITDRICIHSGGTEKVEISVEDLLTCCPDCGDGCNGGWPDAAWRYWRDTGIVSGGGYGSNDGCKAYAFPPCGHLEGSSKPPCRQFQPTPACQPTCDNSSMLTYTRDLYKGASAYYLDTNEMGIQLEIMTNGPVEASFSVFEDFVNYQSGVYKNVAGRYLGGHAVKILGWGVENDVKYWIAANSWNEDWGDKGYFKILRGENECGIEEQITAGLP